jgi:hypothetical protein
MSMCDVPTSPREQPPCPGCGRQLPRTVAYFHKDALGRQGLKRRCRDCVNAGERARYAASADAIRARVRQRRAERAELLRDSPQWRPTERHEATDQHGSVAFFMTHER